LTLEALIFDVDGTLADTEEAHRQAFNSAFEELKLGWNWSQPTYTSLLLTTGGKERLGAYIQSLDVSALERATFERQIDALHAAKTRHYTRMVLAGAVPLRDGVLRLLDDAARNRIRLAIATTTTYKNIEALLETHLGPGALERFVVIGAADQASRKKPAPDIYEYVLGAMGLPPEVCVAFEDSVNGLRAAKGAGLYTIVTPCFWTATEDFSAADLVLPSLGCAERPLPPQAAALVGADVLGIREIEHHLNQRHLHIIRET
jgi:beta-phosphoglucomutase-like phosphatase (HAD superfamily)